MKYNTVIQANSNLQQDKYKIIKKLGQDDLSITYEALHTLLNTRVAIKEFFLTDFCIRNESNTISPQSISIDKFADFKNIFLQEAQALVKIDHPNIVRVTDIFEENNTVYMVMQYIEGKTLEELIKYVGKLSEKESLDYISQTAIAIEELHNNNLLHRDLKPDNVIIDKKGKAILIDFGTARDFADGKTITHTAMLTPNYVPTEEYSERQERGAFTDIYSLGATLYYCLTGQKPLQATDRRAIGEGEDVDRIDNPRKLNAAISAHIEGVILKSMALIPQNRYQTIKDFLNAINEKEKTEFSQVSGMGKHIMPPVAKTNFPLQKNILYILLIILSILFSVGYWIYDNLEKKQILALEKQTRLDSIKTVEAKQARLVYEAHKLEEARIIEIQRKKEEQIRHIERNLQSINRHGVKMVYVEGGTFNMGCTSEQTDCDSNEIPVRQIVVSSFYIGKYEVTQKQYKEIMGENPSENKCYYCPVESVTWSEIKKFIIRLNLKTGCKFRLPTEAEWEYAARGGNRSKGFKYSGSNNIDEVAWYHDRRSGRRHTTHKTGTKKANELGVFDMSGNVWELCESSSGDYVVIRGGCWTNEPKHCRVSCGGEYGGWYYGQGFRLAVSQ